MDLARFFQSFDSLMMRIIKPIVIVLCLIVAFGITFGIVTRIVFEQPMFGLEEIVLMAVMWLYMFGAVFASRDRTHLAADFVQVITKNKKIIGFMHLVASVISFIIAVFICTWCYELMIWAIAKKQTTPVFNIPWYFSQSSLFVASVFFVIYLLRDIAVDTHSLLTK